MAVSEKVGLDRSGRNETAFHDVVKIPLYTCLFKAHGIANTPHDSEQNTLKISKYFILKFAFFELKNLTQIKEMNIFI